MAQQHPWYHQTAIYQIYPRSFFDSNGDGIGDIQGIIRKLDYIQSLGYQTIWCSPFFTSPQQDFGYDVADYRNIAAEFGTLNDAQQLIDEVHKRGMRIVFDMVMNHTSLEHPWFKEDEQGISNRYIWADKPNNWKSMTGGSGWHYNEKRKQYYWASFLPFQPDLNYRNPEVKTAMLNNVRFWLQKGVDGFRLDIFNVIYKDAELRNNPFSMKAVPDEKNPNGFFQQFKYTINQPESFDFARELRSVCDEFGEKMLLGEVSGNRTTIRKYLGKEKNDGLGLVFNFEMLRFKFKAKYFEELVRNVESDFPEPFMPVYVFSNHDRRRSMTRLHGNVDKARLLHFFQLSVRGVPCMYYGEEIGMIDARIPFKKGLDPIAQKMKNVPRVFFDLAGETPNRDELRTPMQWDTTLHAGFSVAEKTWLPVHTNYATVNVQELSKQQNSLPKTIEKLLQLRNNIPALHAGNIELIDRALLPKNVLGYLRSYDNETVLMLLNFGSHPVNVVMQNNLRKIYALHNADTIQNGNVALSAFGAIMLSKQNEK